MQLAEKLKGEKRWIYWEGALFVGFFLAAFLLCGQISYTDGDDAYFFQTVHSMPFFDYLKMRYVEWEGRVTSEAMTYVAFWFGKSFWQPMNALILTLLPYGLISMVKRMVGGLTARKSFLLALTVYLGILALGIEVIGYGAFWITGSTFYLWSIVAGLWASMPFVAMVYGQKQTGATVGGNGGTGKKSEGFQEEQPGTAAREYSTFLYAIPCAFIAAMGQEQIAAVVIAFGALAVLYHVARERKIPWLHLLEVVLMIVALAALFFSPGTEARSQAEIDLWLPQYATMSVGNHIFITLQWMLSSFANEGKMLFFLIWVVGSWLLWSDRERGRSVRSRILMGFCGIFAVVSLLPYLGVLFFSEMGMGVADVTQPVLQVATPATVSVQNWVAIVWWTCALVFTLVLLWHLEQGLRDKAVAALLVLAACASEAIMYFSPTMYASGARVFFVAQILLWLTLGRLCGKLFKQQGDWPLVALVGAAGVLNFINGIPTLLKYL